MASTSIAAPAAQAFLREAVALARDNADRGGRPFGAVVVRDGEVIARAVNRILDEHDPTAHAELLALREAGRALGSARLDGCEVYASGHPCPMCVAAMRMAGVHAAYYVYSNEDAEPFGLSTAAIARELAGTREQLGMVLAHVPLDPVPDPMLYSYWKQVTA